MDGDEFLMVYMDPVPIFGDEVWIPPDEEVKAHTHIGVITSDPDGSGRVRVDWDDEKHSHHWKFYSSIELKVAE